MHQTKLLAAEESGGSVIVAERRTRGPRKGFKHWTSGEDARLRDTVLTALDRLGTLQAIVQECHSDFNRDEGSVLRRIRHLRQSDAELDAAIAGRVVRARALADENRGSIAPVAPVSTATPAAIRPAAKTAAPAQGVPTTESSILARFLEDNTGPISSEHRRKLAGLVATHGQVSVMAALADSLLNRADVILSDVEARLRRSR